MRFLVDGLGWVSLACGALLLVGCHGPSRSIAATPAEDRLEAEKCRQARIQAIEKEQWILWEEMRK